MCEFLPISAIFERQFASAKRVLGVEVVEMIKARIVMCLGLILGLSACASTQMPSRGASMTAPLLPEAMAALTADALHQAESVIAK